MTIKAGAHNAVTSRLAVAGVKVSGVEKVLECSLE